MLDPSEPWSTGRPFEFGGVRLVDLDLSAAVASLESAAQAGRSQGLHLCNAFTLTLALRDDELRETLSQPDCVNLPDGTPVAWFYRLAYRRPARGPVRGPSLMKATLERTNLRHFLLGGTDEVLSDLEGAIEQRYPACTVVGRHSPPFRKPTEDDLEDFARRIKESRAQVVWVGLGTPRQDHVIAALVGRVDAVLVGVGAAFDFISGHKPEAPIVLHRTGLEWAYRLAHEPRRLWRRYLIGNTLFLIHATRQLVDRAPRTFPPEPGGDGQLAEVPRVAVGAASVHCIDEPAVLDLVIRAAADAHQPPWLVVTPNIQHVALLEVDAELRAAYGRADLVLADGWPVVRAVQLLAHRRLQRITGADIFPALCQRAAELGLRVGIVGGMDGAAEEASRRLSARFPGLEVALTLEPTLGFERDEGHVGTIVNKVRDADIDILFLALGAPKQEKFAAQHLDAMGAGVTLCVGAAVDFVAGRQRRAPHLLRRFGLEWAYRAVHEPRRLVPRYARSAPVFLRAVSRSRRERRGG